MLSKFYALSGLQVSFQKCEVFCCNVPSNRQLFLAGELGMKLGTLPVRYLGVPLISGKLRLQGCQPLIDKITSRIKSWTSKFLTFAGRLLLIDSVLNIMINYWMAISSSQRV